MALGVLQLLTASGGERAQRHALIDLHVVADHGRFTNDDAGAVVDEEILADRGTRMDIDARDAVGVFGHDARDQRNAELKQLMRDTAGKDGIQSRIGTDDLVLVVRRGIAVIGRLDIGFDILPDPRDRFEKRKGDPLCRLSDRITVGVFINGRVPQDDRGLLDQVVDDVLQQDGDIVADGISPVVPVSVIARIDDDLDLFQNVDHDILVGVFEHFDLIDRSAPAVILHQAVSQRVDPLIH